MNLKEITAISKQKTALVFPNAILVEVGEKKVSRSDKRHAALGWSDD